MLPEKSLRECPEIDFICRKEFDFAVVDYAKGKPLEEIPGASLLKDGKIVHNPDAPQIQDLDALPHVTDIYRRDLDVTKYNVPFLLHPSCRCTRPVDARRNVRFACGRRP